MPTTKDAPVITPPLIVHPYEATADAVGVDTIVHNPSRVKPPPVTAIVWPCRPEVGDRKTAGAIVTFTATEVS